LVAQVFQLKILEEDYKEQEVNKDKPLCLNKDSARKWGPEVRVINKERLLGWNTGFKMISSILKILIFQKVKNS